MSTDPNKVIYSMLRVSRFYNKKPVIKDISLSYFHGAKIGVLGLNGSGKSTLLKIMAGLDTEFNGPIGHHVVTIVAARHRDASASIGQGRAYRIAADRAIAAVADDGCHASPPPTAFCAGVRGRSAPASESY